VSGEYVVSCTLDGRHVRGSPHTVLVRVRVRVRVS